MQPTIALAADRRARIRVSRRAVAAVAAAAAAAGAVGGLAELRVWPPLATVMSASMAPTINTGDIVVFKRIDGAAQVGDIVAVTVPDEARSRYGYPPRVIHRVMRIRSSGTVVTKGDARAEADPFTVPRTALTTKVVGTVPAAGRMIAFLTSGLGLLWIGLGALLFGAVPLIERQRAQQQRDVDSAEELHDHLDVIAEELVRVQSRLPERRGSEDVLDARLRELIQETAAMREQIGAMAAALTQRPPAPPPSTATPPLTPAPPPTTPPPFTLTTTRPLAPPLAPTTPTPTPSRLTPAPPPRPTLPARSPVPVAQLRRRSGGLVGAVRGYGPRSAGPTAPDEPPDAQPGRLAELRASASACG
jgi:signal peptidase I